MTEDKELEQMLVRAQTIVKKAKITDNDLKVEAFRYALNYMWAKKYGTASKRASKKPKK